MSFKYVELDDSGKPTDKTHPTCWQFEDRWLLSDRWIFHTNKNSYVKKVDDEVK